MTLSMNFAMFFCLYFIVFGLAVLLNPRVFIDAMNDFLGSRGQMLLGGIMALLFGALVVSFHNYYLLGWPIIITILGWLSFLKGVIYLLSPQSIRRLAVYYQTEKAIKINGVVSIVFGLFFLFILFLM